MNKIIIAAVVALALAGCGSSAHTKAATSPSASASEPPHTDPDFPTPTSTPTPSPTPQLPAGMFDVQDTSGDEAHISVAVIPNEIALPGETLGGETLSGEQVAALKVTIVGVSGTYAVSGDDFEVPHGDGGRAVDGTHDEISIVLPGNQSEMAAGASVCTGFANTFPTTFDPSGLANLNPLTVPAGTTTVACLPFIYLPAGKPATVALTGTDASWPLVLGGGTSGTVSPTTLATFSGSGSALLTLPTTVTSASNVKIAWAMPSDGNNIIEAEDDTAGNGLDLLTNVVGANNNSLDGVQLNETYLQVLSEGSWTITITNF